MVLEQYIRGNSSAIYTIFNYKKLYLVTDTFHRVFFLNIDDLKKVEGHSYETIKNTYDLHIKVLNNKNDRELRENLENTLLYKEFKDFVREELREEFIHE